MQDIIQNFIQLYKHLVDHSPHLAVHNFKCENSDYSDQLNESKNAYLCFNGYGIEDCYYTYDSRWNKDCADLSYSNKCELCYNLIDCDECYNCDFCQECEHLADSCWCYDCFSCQNCFGCVGIRHGEFQIFNKKYSKQDYWKKIAEIKKWPESKIRDEIEKLRKEYPHITMKLRRSEKIFGNHIFDSKNVFYGFKLHDCEDCFYIYDSRNLRDCCDIGMMHKSELVYDSIEATENYNCNFIYWCANCRNSEYLMYCFDCEFCFGCFNLKRKKYHILNKQYKEKGYFNLVSKIKNTLRKKGDYRNFLPDIVQHKIAII